MQTKIYLLAITLFLISCAGNKQQEIKKNNKRRLMLTHCRKKEKLFASKHCRDICLEYMKRRMSGLPATQAGCEVYMPLVQHHIDTAYTDWLSPRARMN